MYYNHKRKRSADEAIIISNKKRKQEDSDSISSDENIEDSNSLSSEESGEDSASVRSKESCDDASSSCSTCDTCDGSDNCSICNESDSNSSSSGLTNDNEGLFDTNDNNSISSIKDENVKDAPSSTIEPDRTTNLPLEIWNLILEYVSVCNYKMEVHENYYNLCLVNKNFIKMMKINPGYPRLVIPTDISRHNALFLPKKLDYLTIRTGSYASAHYYSGLFNMSSKMKSLSMTLCEDLLQYSIIKCWDLSILTHLSLIIPTRYQTFTLYSQTSPSTESRNINMLDIFNENRRCPNLTSLHLHCDRHKDVAIVFNQIKNYIPLDLKYLKFSSINTDPKWHRDSIYTKNYQLGVARSNAFNFPDLSKHDKLSSLILDNIRMTCSSYSNNNHEFDRSLVEILKKLPVNLKELIGFDVTVEAPDCVNDILHTYLPKSLKKISTTPYIFSTRNNILISIENEKFKISHLLEIEDLSIKLFKSWSYKPPPINSTSLSLLRNLKKLTVSKEFGLTNEDIDILPKSIEDIRISAHNISIIDNLYKIKTFKLSTCSRALVKSYVNMKQDKRRNDVFYLPATSKGFSYSRCGPKIMTKTIMPVNYDDPVRRYRHDYFYPHTTMTVVKNIDFVVEIHTLDDILDFEKYGDETGNNAYNRPDWDFY